MNIKIGLLIDSIVVFILYTISIVFLIDTSIEIKEFGIDLLFFLYFIKSFTFIVIPSIYMFFKYKDTMKIH